MRKKRYKPFVCIVFLFNFKNICLHVTTIAKSNIKYINS